MACSFTKITSELEPLDPDKYSRGPVRSKVPEFNPVSVSVTATDEISIFPVFDTVIV